MHQNAVPPNSHESRALLHSKIFAFSCVFALTTSLAPPPARADAITQAYLDAQRSKCDKSLRNNENTPQKPEELEVLELIASLPVSELEPELVRFKKNGWITEKKKIELELFWLIRNHRAIAQEILDAPAPTVTLISSLNPTSPGFDWESIKGQVAHLEQELIDATLPYQEKFSPLIGHNLNQPNSVAISIPDIKSLIIRALFASWAKTPGLTQLRSLAHGYAVESTIKQMMTLVGLGRLYPSGLYWETRMIHQGIDDQFIPILIHGPELRKLATQQLRLASMEFEPH